MSRNSNGDYSLPATWNPVVSNTKILAAWANGSLNDVAVALTASLDRSGNGGMLAGLKGYSGAVGAPGYTFSAETTSGFYRVASGDIGASIAGVLVAGLNASGWYQSDLAVSPSFYRVGFREVPQNSQSAAYTLVASDAGKHIFHPSADTTARIWTIPANASVAYPIGTAITFVNQNGAGTITIAITSDTMRLAGAGTTGSRTLAANGVATALKVASTEWIISGTGLT